jgi:hypothetical protein
MTFEIECGTAFIPNTNTPTEPEFTYSMGTSINIGRDTLVTAANKINTNLVNIKEYLDYVADRIAAL